MAPRSLMPPIRIHGAWRTPRRPHGNWASTSSARRGVVVLPRRRQPLGGHDVDAYPAGANGDRQDVDDEPRPAAVLGHELARRHARPPVASETLADLRGEVAGDV